MEDRSEEEIIEQARLFLADPEGERWPPSTLRLLFSMALTWCHLSRANAYPEHDANRLLRRVVFDAKEMLSTATEGAAS